jgi:hypothetical protein
MNKPKDQPKHCACQHTANPGQSTDYTKNKEDESCVHNIRPSDVTVNQLALASLVPPCGSAFSSQTWSQVHGENRMCQKPSFLKRSHAAATELLDRGKPNSGGSINCT